MALAAQSGDNSYCAQGATQPRFGVYGIIHAVNEFALRYKWPVEYVAMHYANLPDIALRRP